MAEEGNQTTGDAWGDDIIVERKATLEARLQAWEQEVDHDGKRGPFERFRLTGADVFWLAARSIAQSADENVIVMVKAQSLSSQVVVPAEPELHLEGADLWGAYLRGADLRRAHLDGADLRQAQLEGVNLDDGYLDEAILGESNLERAHLNRAHLKEATLVGSHVQGASLEEAQLEGADLTEAHLEGANLREAHLENSDLSRAHLERAYLGLAHLEGAVLGGAHLEGADLNQAQLEGADLVEAHLEGVDFQDAHLGGRRFTKDDEDLQHYGWLIGIPSTLPPADLRRAFFDRATLLDRAVFGTAELGCVRVADTRWGEVNLAVVDWGDAPILQDELVVKGWEGLPPAGTRKRLSRKERRAARQQLRVARLNLYRDAVRGNRQLATVLRTQGLNDDADKFAYRAQLLQRRVLRLQGRRTASAFSWLLDLVSGYGYQPVRSVIAYVVIILIFAGLYLLNGQFAAPHLRPDEALVLSISSFHGRGFFTSGISLGDNLARLAAGEAIVGLLIEITFIATFTQRFFAR
jgi:uncharacterized protein YjbI with pentapeptide repeats